MCESERKRECKDIEQQQWQMRFRVSDDYDDDDDDDLLRNPVAISLLENALGMGSVHTLVKLT